jgi:hypothetical protein
LIYVLKWLFDFQNENYQSYYSISTNPIRSYWYFDRTGSGYSTVCGIKGVIAL